MGRGFKLKGLKERSRDANGFDLFDRLSFNSDIPVATRDIHLRCQYTSSSKISGCMKVMDLDTIFESCHEFGQESADQDLVDMSRSARGTLVSREATTARWFASEILCWMWVQSIYLRRCVVWSWREQHTRWIKFSATTAEVYFDLYSSPDLLWPCLTLNSCAATGLACAYVALLCVWI
ncbi:hypothetical protein BDP27DRAFT_770888 [Rhodocollybia butyracea]|uniref:Uncharacterized protein n=1 Tax=Rhodocollybia butyracea TaxID=206335 RepID=A0A9P5TVE0_9AGAR|nr:hypothetical protein BDP27DRAFT_770888 [Rhodocollybia butyracea]